MINIDYDSYFPIALAEIATDREATGQIRALCLIIPWFIEVGEIMTLLNLLEQLIIKNKRFSENHVELYLTYLKNIKDHILYAHYGR